MKAGYAEGTGDGRSPSRPALCYQGLQEQNYHSSGQSWPVLAVSRLWRFRAECLPIRPLSGHPNPANDGHLKTGDLIITGKPIQQM